LEELAAPLRSTMEEFGYSLYDVNLNAIIQQQTGVFRTNCLDCLDRTNVVQTLFGKELLKLWLKQTGISMSFYDQQTLETSFNNLWADVFHG
jgi:inositol-1,4,5-trisphosphate 5-phosphatase